MARALRWRLCLFVLMRFLSMREALAFANSLEKQLARTLGAVPVLFPILERLDLQGIVGRYCPSGADLDNGIVALALVLNRLMAPRPLYKVASWTEQTTLPETLGIEAEKLHDRRLGDLLDALHPHLDCLWKELVHKAVGEFGLRLDFVHYDITSVYFEGDYTESELLEYGYSRDHRPDTKQVNLRLNITGETALPLAFAVISGSTSDSTTPVENMKALRTVLKGLPGADDLIIVSDQAMLSPKALGAYDQEDMGFLGPLPSRKEHQGLLMEPSLEELKQQPLAYRPRRQSSAQEPAYYGIVTPLTLTGECAGQQHPVEAQALMLYSRGKAHLDRQKRQTLLKRYLDRLEKISSYLNRLKYKRKHYAQEQLSKAAQRHSAVSAFVHVALEGEDGALDLHVEVDERALARATAGDGRYLLVTNRSLTAEEMLARFKEQDRIEKRIEAIKGPIRIRPMFLHKQERIEALVFICMVALMVYSILEYLLRHVDLEATGRHVLEQFASLSAIYSYFGDGSLLKQAAPPTAFQRTVLKRLRFPPAHTYVNSVLHQ